MSLLYVAVSTVNEVIHLQVDSSAGSQAEAGILGLGWPALLSATKWLCNQFLVKSFQDQG